MSGPKVKILVVSMLTLVVTVATALATSIARPAQLLSMKTPKQSVTPSPEADPSLAPKPSPLAVGKVEGAQTNTVTTASGKSSNFQIYEQFSGTSLNTALWQAMTFPKGYRNHEEQDYLPDQVHVADGKLVITAARDAAGNWHSGEVHSKFNYEYGEFEVRMAVSPTGPGVWPAAWLMGTTDTWPNNGELDILENINGGLAAYGTIHGGGSNGHWQLQKTFSPIDVTQYHTYKIVKQPGGISWWIDGTKRGEWLQSQTPPGGIWPFESHRNFALLNLAIGGDWPGPSSAATPGAIQMSVDYFTVKNGS